MNRFLRVFTGSLLAAALLAGCAFSGLLGKKQHTATYLDLFDTVTTLVGYAPTEADFLEEAGMVYDTLRYHHQLFDIYRDYPGINNLKTVNDFAGISPVEVDPAIIRLLQDCRHYCEITDGRVDVTMGSVLRLWHEARSEGLSDPAAARLPDPEALKEAAAHTGFDRIVIDEEAGTVFITDPETSLDVGAIAKGWAVEQAAQSAPEGILISVGGNVSATGPKPDGAAWVIGIQHPEGGGSYLHTVSLTRGTAVTSGDYQRTYTVNGKAYHHIIDPDTGMPAELWRSVTVVGTDSGLADALSTALFLLPMDAGKALAEALDVEVLWVDTRGETYMTPGFQALILS